MNKLLQFALICVLAHKLLSWPQCSCDYCLVGDAEAPWSSSADWESQYDVPGEWDTRHSSHCSGTGWEVSPTYWWLESLQGMDMAVVFFYVFLMLSGKNIFLSSEEKVLMFVTYCYRLIENVSPEKAVQLYQQAASVFEVSGGFLWVFWVCWIFSFWL